MQRQPLLCYQRRKESGCTAPLVPSGALGPPCGQPQRFTGTEWRAVSPRFRCALGSQDAYGFNTHPRGENSVLDATHWA
jgi:hypothetical protein